VGNPVALEETPERRNPGALAALFQFPLKLGESHIGLLCHRAKNEGCLGARETKTDWDCWGNQAGLFDQGQVVTRRQPSRLVDAPMLPL
jgi:hypothetical protein